MPIWPFFPNLALSTLKRKPHHITVSASCRKYKKISFPPYFYIHLVRGHDMHLLHHHKFPYLSMSFIWPFVIKFKIKNTKNITKMSQFFFLYRYYKMLCQFWIKCTNTVSMIYKHKLTKYKNHKTQGRRGRVNYFFSRYIILLDPEG